MTTATQTQSDRPPKAQQPPSAHFLDPLWNTLVEFHKDVLPFSWTDRKGGSEQVKPVLTTMTRAIGKLPGGSTQPVRLVPHLQSHEWNLGFALLKRELQGIPMHSSAVSLVKDQDSYHPPTLSSEAHLESWFAQIYGLLFRKLSAAAPNLSNMELSFQVDLPYVGPTDSTSHATADIAIKEQGRILSLAEVKHGKRLTHEHFQLLDACDKGKDKNLFMKVKKETCKVVFFYAHSEREEGYEEVPRNLANALTMVMEPSAYAWVSDCQWSVVWNGDRSLVTRNGLHHTRQGTYPCIFFSDSFGLDAEGEPLPITTRAPSSDEITATVASQPVGYDLVATPLEDVSRMSRTLDSGEAIYKPLPAKPGSVPGSLFMLLVSLACLKKLEPDAGCLQGRWPKPDVAAEHTPQLNRQQGATGPPQSYRPAVPDPATPTPRRRD